MHTSSVIVIRTRIALKSTVLLYKLTKNAPFSAKVLFYYQVTTRKQDSQVRTPSISSISLSMYAGALFCTVLLYFRKSRIRRSLFLETYTETVPHKEPLKIWIRKFFERSQVTYRFAEAESCIDRNRIVKQYIYYLNEFVQSLYTHRFILRPVSRLCGFRVFRGSRNPA